MIKNKVKELKKELVNLWKDNSGISSAVEKLGWVIVSLALVAIIAGIGITAAKTKAAGISGELTNFKVSGPSGDAITTGATGTEADVTSGDHTITGITIKE